MKFELSVQERLRLRLTAYTARCAILRKRSVWVLAIAEGVPVSRIARFSGVSRPTVYRYLKIWFATRDPLAMVSRGSGVRLADHLRGCRLQEETPVQ